MGLLATEPEVTVTISFSKVTELLLKDHREKVTTNKDTKKLQGDDKGSKKAGNNQKG